MPPFGESPASTVPSDLGIGLHSDQHARAIARQRRELVDRFARRLQEERLLPERLLQIVRGEAEALERELDLLGAGFAALDEPTAADDRFAQRGAIAGGPDDASPSDHGD